MKFVLLSTLSAGILLLNQACNSTQAKQQPAQQAMPVKVQPVDLHPVPQTTEYVAIIKSRRSANIQPQVDGNITKILVKSGDKVRAGQLLMTIDPLKQEAVVNQQRGTEAQMKANFEYNKSELERQKGLYEAQIEDTQCIRNHQLISNSFNSSSTACTKSSWPTIASASSATYTDTIKPAN